MRGMSLAIAAALAASERMMLQQPVQQRDDPAAKLYETRQDQRRAKRKAEKQARKADRQSREAGDTVHR